VRGLLSQPVCAKEERNQQPSSNQGVSKVELRHSHAVCTHPSDPHPTTSSGLALSACTELSKRQCQTSQDESCMMSKDGFLSECQREEKVKRESEGGGGRKGRQKRRGRKGEEGARGRKTEHLKLFHFFSKELLLGMCCPNLPVLAVIGDS